MSELRDWYPDRLRGTYTLNDLADMHEAMDEEDEYRRRHEDVK